MLAARFIPRFTLFSIFAALSFVGAHAQTVKLHSATAPQKEVPAAPASKPPAAGQRIHPARPGSHSGSVPKVANKPSNDKAAENKTAN